MSQCSKCNDWIALPGHQGAWNFCTCSIGKAQGLTHLQLSVLQWLTDQSRLRQEIANTVDRFKHTYGLMGKGLLRSTMTEYIHMAQGKALDVRTEYYSGYPDWFFQKVCDEMGWVWCSKCNGDGTVTRLCPGNFDLGIMSFHETVPCDCQR